MNYYTVPRITIQILSVVIPFRILKLLCFYYFCYFIFHHFLIFLLLLFANHKKIQKTTN